MWVYERDRKGATLVDFLLNSINDSYLIFFKNELITMMLHKLTLTSVFHFHISLGFTGTFRDPSKSTSANL